MAAGVGGVSVCRLPSQQANADAEVEEKPQERKQRDEEDELVHL
jgi:hypothetical protein